VLLSYLDESYDRERYWICALVVDGGVAITLTEALDAVVAKAVDAYGVPDDAELHGHALFHGKEAWERLARQPRARIGIYHDAFAAIAEHATAVIARGVHVPGLNDRYVRPHHPHTVVLQHLLEDIDVHAGQLDDHALVIADEVDRANEYRADLWRFQRAPTPGYRSRRLTRIADTIHFAPSTSSRLLQGADLIAFLNRRIRADVRRDEREERANRALWERVGPLVWRLHCWRP
jgi:hypothetical protein